MPAARVQKASKCERRDVVDTLAGRQSQGTILCEDAGIVQRLLALQNFILGGLRDHVETSKDCHRKYGVPALAPTYRSGNTSPATPRMKFEIRASEGCNFQSPRPATQPSKNM